MKKTLITVLVATISGAIAGFLIHILVLAPEMMLVDESRFDFETTITTIEQAATSEGWSVPIIHDLQKSMAKSGREVNKVKVFALCNPEHAIRILAGDEERIYSNMMPCRLSVYTTSDGKTYVSRMNIPAFAKGMPKNVKSTMKAAYKDMENILSGILK